MKKTFLGLALLSAIALQTQAAELEITVTNISQLSFTPLLVAGHEDDAAQRIFRLGEMASAGLELLAETGATATLNTAITNAGAVTATATANLAAGATSPAFNLSTSATQKYLSIGAMFLPSNDGFVGVDSWPIPKQPGTYRFRMNGYDAGTEANAETDATMPAGVVPGQTDGSGVTTATPNTRIHIHPGNIGDFVATGAGATNISDIDARVHRFHNPLAVVTVIVK